MLWNRFGLLLGLGLCASLILSGCASTGAGNDDGVRTPKPMKEDSQHVRTWNKFVDDLLALHKRIIAETPHSMTSKVGGYANFPRFYVEKEYRDKAGHLLSRVQWEREHPDTLHVIEVNRYDAKGRVVRDYAGAYLPVYHNAPVQTLVSLHGYNGKLHAFRTFDASGDMLYERCQGRYKGKSVDINLDFDDVYVMEGKPDTVLTSKAYRACFHDVAKTAGDYVHPQ